MKRILALILAILLVLGTFAACVANEPTETEKNTDKQTEKRTQTDDEGTEDNTDEGTDEETDKESNKETDKETDEAETCTEHVDADKNHACDKCKTEVGTHADSTTDGDHVCDYGCGATLTACADSDKNHKCDDCQTTMGYHEDSINDRDHKCDYGCGAALTACSDSNIDGICDECGDQMLYTRVGKKITFGSYPQTQVTDETLLTTLNAMAGTLPTRDNAQTWTSYGYYISGEKDDFMWYKDVTVGSDKYRGVYFITYRPYYSYYSSSDLFWQHDNGYEINNVYWFKYEPISWTILSENTTEGTALILCDMTIDSQEYHNNIRSRTVGNERIYINNYAHSTIRKWLNETFYNTAFNELQKQMILTTTVDNSVESTGYDTNLYACENTEDKAFLLSYQDVTNSNYGFLADQYEQDTLRQKKTTDYARIQGVHTNSGDDYDKNSSWWLRSPKADNSVNARDVYNDGCAMYHTDVTNTAIGVAPALQIRF